MFLATTPEIPALLFATWLIHPRYGIGRRATMAVTIIVCLAGTGLCLIEVPCGDFSRALLLSLALKPPSLLALPGCCIPWIAAFTQPRTLIPPPLLPRCSFSKPVADSHTSGCRLSAR